MSKKRNPLSPSDLDLHRRLMFLALAQSDMSQSIEAVDFALKHARSGDEQTSQYIAYCEVAIIRYARPFCASRIVAVDAKLRANVALGTGYLPKHPGAAPLHAHVISLRSSMVAHSDMRNRNVVLARDSHGWLPSVMHQFLLPGHLSNLQFIARHIVVRLREEIDAEAVVQWPHLPEGEEVQIGGGNPKYIEALQQGWLDRRKR